MHPIKDQAVPHKDRLTLAVKPDRLTQCKKLILLHRRKQRRQWVQCVTRFGQLRRVGMIGTQFCVCGTLRSVHQKSPFGPARAAAISAGHFFLFSRSLAAPLLWTPVATSG